MMSFLYIKSIIIVLSALILKVNAETKIIAKSGDTLFKLSKQYGVSLKELMHKNNFINANTIIEGEPIIIPLNNNSKANANANANANARITYEVKKGDTLYKIASDYNVNIKDIISINNLDSLSFLKPNQIIILPEGASYKKEIYQQNNKLRPKKVFYHQTSKAEQLEQIANTHDISTQEIINLNNLINPITIKSNTKLKIRQNKTLKWIKYGSLMINWSEWRYLDGNYITQAKNKKNKSFFIAISCKKRTLNNTLKNSYWTSWYFPASKFEFKLINDFCDQSFKI